MSSEKPKVYFTKTISPEKVVEMFKVLNKPLPGKVAVKVHSGEKGNQNFLKPEFFKPIVEHVKGTIIECNTAYPGARNYTEKHKVLMDEHGDLGFGNWYWGLGPNPKSPTPHPHPQTPKNY